MTTELDQLRAKHELRLEIARLRRRINGRVRRVERQGRRLLSWRTYARRYPAYAVLAALGLGLAAAAGLRRGGWARHLGLHLVHRAINRGVDNVLEELQRIWAGSTPGNENLACDGGEDDRSRASSM